jgi:large subunit ribosomal protein L31
MKKDIHPKEYRFVVFEDLNNGERILTRSTVASDEVTKWEDGNEYPIVKVHISSSSHPFFTGQEKLVDIEGRVDKFKARQEAAIKARTEAHKRTARPAEDKPSTSEPKSQKMGRLNTAK